MHISSVILGVIAPEFSSENLQYDRCQNEESGFFPQNLIQRTVYFSIESLFIDLTAVLR